MHNKRGAFGGFPHLISFLRTDEKILAVPSGHISKRYDRVENYTDLPEITLKQIEHFFAHYKDLEPGKWVKIIRWGDAAEAKRLILDGVERAASLMKKP